MSALPKNLCLAPFVVTTINPTGQQSPCPTLGGDLWDLGPTTKLQDRWQSVQLQDFRKATLDNARPEVCGRCWREEEADGYSFRTELWNPDTDTDGKTTKLYGTPISPQVALREKFYANGPMQIVMKVNNICNLRCRSCNSKDSYLYKIEGNYYKEKYADAPFFSKEKQIPDQEFYTDGPDATEWTDDQLLEIFNFSVNLRRLELYGGEPLIDTQTPKLLKLLADSGRSERIDLNISTNATKLPSQEWLDSLKHFKKFNLNLSLDGTEKHFEYLRFPAKWKTVRQNIDYFRYDLAELLEGRYTLLPIVTVSILNIYYLPELMLNLRDIVGEWPHLNLVTNPSYYRIDILPTAVKQAIIKKFKEFNLPKLDPYIEILDSPFNEETWENFKFWTKAKDEYRKENFANTFPEFYAIIKLADPTF